jgi:hypothetical protein
MVQKTEILSPEIIDNLRNMQSKANELINTLGQLHLRIKNFKLETERLIDEQKLIEAQFELNDKKFTDTISDLEQKYPKGEIDLNEGVVIYESAE